MLGKEFRGNLEYIKSEFEERIKQILPLEDSFPSEDYPYRQRIQSMRDTIKTIDMIIREGDAE